MADVEIVHRQTAVADFRLLRESCGWPVPGEAACAKALANSLFHAIAVIDGQTVGMGRVVGDGSLINYIQDLIVLPAYQSKGIGKLLMDALMAYLTETADPGSTVGLISATGAIEFYRQYGFYPCPPDVPTMRREL